MVSVDGNPQAVNDQLSLEGRNEVLWVNRGWVDVIFNMDYRSRIDYETVDQVRAVLDHPGKLYPLFGNFDLIDGQPVPRSGRLIEKYIKLSRSKWPDSGVAFYIFQMLNDAQISTLKQGVFAETAKPNWPGSLAGGKIGEAAAP